MPPTSSTVLSLRVRERRVEYHAHQLLRVPRLSCGQPRTGNLLIQGDNLPVLDALAGFEGQARCVYIDPPYNNRERYTHYTDAVDHGTWLREIGARIERLAKFLRRDGSLWISIDDSEGHYLKVATDEIMGRHNFVAMIVWQHRTSRENRRVFSTNHEYLLVYARDARAFGQARNLLPLTVEVEQRYRNPDNDPRGPWQSVSAHVQAGHATRSQFHEIEAPNGRLHRPPKGRCWVFGSEKMRCEIAQGNVWFGADGNGVPRLKRFLKGARLGLTPQTLWSADEVGTTDLAKKHLLRLFPKQSLFDTPKPEQLLKRVLEISTDPGDLVLDAYLGSGTTAAVAHKMGRKYLGIEAGTHAVTHCAQRLKRVVDGEEGGISRDVGWRGGGGFDFARLSR